MLTIHRLAAVLAACAALAAVEGAARAQLVLRGNYWRDRNTRVLAPEAELARELPSTGTTVHAAYLLDAITSASAAAGVASDHPFTELRNQLTVGASQRLGALTIGGSYRYSTESDYWSHSGVATAALDLFDHNTTLAGTFAYTHADVGRRTGPAGYTPVGDATFRYLAFTFSQVLTRALLVSLGYELSDDGDVKDPRSFLANPYRTVLVSGTPTLEVVPRERVRLAVTGGARYGWVFPGHTLSSLALYAKYRFYTDDWGVRSHAPELRAHVGLGQLVVLRATGRLYTQTAADFFRTEGPTSITPSYPTGGVRRSGCPSSGCYTADAKLSPFSSGFLELAASLRLDFLATPRVPLATWLAGGTLTGSVGHYFNGGFAKRQYGDAWVAGLELLLPL